jgi:stage V sporulation protein G
MEITEVKVKLAQNRTDRLRAFCTITFDNDFVVRDLKVIEGTNGLFVAMPSRKLTDKCFKCGAKNHLKASYCNECGAKLPELRAEVDAAGRAKLHADIAHPINSACRERIQKAVEKAFNKELEASKRPGYRPSYEDEEDYDDASYGTNEPESRASRVEEQTEGSEEIVESDSGEVGTKPEAESSQSGDSGEHQFGAGIL